MKAVCVKLCDSYTFNPKLYEICEVGVEVDNNDVFWGGPYYNVKSSLHDIDFIYPIDCFMTIDEFREKQIDLIIN